MKLTKKQIIIIAGISVTILLLFTTIFGASYFYFATGKPKYVVINTDDIPNIQATSTPQITITSTPTPTVSITQNSDPMALVKITNKYFSFTLPIGWSIDSDYMKYCSTYSDGECPFIAIKKGNYYLKIEADPQLTGGGFGNRLDSVCVYDKTNTLTQIKSGISRMDMFLDLSKGCDMVNPKQKGIAWIGARIIASPITDNGNYPVINCDLILGKTNKCKQNLILINYGFNDIVSSTDNGITYRDLPAKDSLEVKNMVKEMDSIVLGVKAN